VGTGIRIKENVVNNVQIEAMYFIPVEDKFIIYLPYKPLVFVGNRAMVQFLKDLQAGQDFSDQNETVQLLRQIGFFEPDRRVLPPETLAKPFKPTIGVLLLTTACNLSCVYCYASAGSGQGQCMPLHTGKWVIDRVCQNAKKLGKKHFSLCLHGGGEPTVAKNHVVELVQYAHAKELECRISLTTNGYFTAEAAEALLNGICEVSLSFDGLAAIQNRQRPAVNGKGSFEWVFHTLKIIEDKKIPYGIRMSVMDDSVDALPENMEFLCRNTQCRTFQVEPVFKSGRARLQNNPLKNNTKFTRAFMNAMEIAFEHGRHMYYSGVRPWLVTSSFCLAPQEALIVNHNNELTACYEVYDQSHELGGLFFYGAFNGNNGPEIDLAKRDRLLHKIKARQAACVEKACFCFPHCAGDCPPKAFLAQENSESGFSDRCELNRELTKEMLLFYLEKSGGVWHGEHITQP
jgi:radical SAM protein with 4Fe4S-binding SPASM domain